MLHVLLLVAILPNLVAWNYKSKLIDFNKGFISCILAASQLSASCYASVYTDEYFKVEYPDSFEVSPKLLKTHERELFTKSINTKGYNFGITVSYTIISFKSYVPLINYQIYYFHCHFVI